MWLLISGVLILLIASLLHSYCAVGVQASPVIAPAIFYSSARILLQIGWIILFVVGTVMLFIVNWIAGIVAIPVYWFVLPLGMTPILKKWMLPSWDDMPDHVKDTMRKLGYNKDNYLRGDWWKAPNYKDKFNTR